MPPNMPVHLTTEDFSEPNTSWGICGFVSVLGALAHTGKFTINAPKDKLREVLVYVMQSYLSDLKSRNQGLVKEIEKFTHSFGGDHASFVIDDFIKQGVRGGKAFGIAMPPSAVVDFLKFHNVVGVFVDPPNPGASGGILGLGRSADQSGSYKGLKHWVYKCDATNIYNWGKKQTLAELQKDMDKIVYYISI